MPQLIVYRKDTLHREYSFSDADILTIGRARTNGIVLPDAEHYVSRQHAVIVRAAGAGTRYFVRDLGSLRCTFVGGEPIHQHLLRDGDVIHIAGYELVYAEADSAPIELPPIVVAPRTGDAH